MFTDIQDIMLNIPEVNETNFNESAGVSIWCARKNQLTAMTGP